MLTMYHEVISWSWALDQNDHGGFQSDGGNPQNLSRKVLVVVQEVLLKKAVKVV